MMERRPWTRRNNRLPPKRFRDLLPQPLPSLPPPETASHQEEIYSHFHLRNSPEPPSLELLPSSSQALEPIRNTFGLSRRFLSNEAPLYDPEDHISLEDLSNIDSSRASSSLHLASSAPNNSPFYPYPNRSAFKLGDWFWNGGVQKSQASFRELVGIVGDPGFHPDDIRDVRWDHVDKILATEDEGEWMEEDAGWTRTAVTISVPYHPRRGIPSSPDARPRNYNAGDFNHKHLVSVIREKLTSHSPHFHFHPYELHWQPNADREPIRVQGELYSSPEFIDAHQKLQSSPGEPGCNLPRVVIALMFWSDVTHLTSFGNAKLWPLYMFFGNESKYYRCKPTSHSCEHVGYFQSVSNPLFGRSKHILTSHSYLIRSRTLRGPRLQEGNHPAQPS